MLPSKVLPAVTAFDPPIALHGPLSAWDGCADKNYMLAIELYGKAIDSDPLNAVYHANRAFAHIRIETYGSAVEDATEAIAIDPKYVKVMASLFMLLYCTCTYLVLSSIAALHLFAAYHSQVLPALCLQHMFTPCSLAMSFSNAKQPCCSAASQPYSDLI